MALQFSFHKMSASSGTQGSSSTGQEYIVRLPRANKKKHHVMQFTSVSNIDMTKLTQVRLERENNMKEFKADDEIPKYGAGSEYGRDQREEARRKKHGISLRKYNPDDQPWILKIGGKGGKKYKGIRGGGITENASYYVFTQAADGAFEASPIEEWYNFSPIQRYKALSAEEAEEEFGRRDKVMNYFSIMVKKRLKKETEREVLDGEEKGQEKMKRKKGKQSSEFKITEMDDWLSDSDNESEDEEEEGENADKKKKTKKTQKDPDDKKKKKNKDSDEEAMEESDEGDFDDREVDYISESSSSSEEEADEKVNREMKGVEDEDALRKLDASDEEEEEEKKEGAENEENAEDKPAPEQKPKLPKDKKGGSSGESSGDTSDSDFDDSNFQSAMFMQKTNRKKTGSDNSASNSRANTPTKMLGDNASGQQKSGKRKVEALDASGSSAKRSKPDATSSSSGNNMQSSSEGITDEAVRRYLMRKPMTTTELLQKFRSTGKKAGVTGNELVTTIAKILKRLNPEKQTIKGKLYLSIKS